MPMKGHLQGRACHFRARMSYQVIGTGDHAISPKHLHYVAFLGFCTIEQVSKVREETLCLSFYP